VKLRICTEPGLSIDGNLRAGSVRGLGSGPRARVWREVVQGLIMQAQRESAIEDREADTARSAYSTRVQNPCTVDGQATAPCLGARTQEYSWLSYVIGLPRSRVTVLCQASRFSRHAPQSRGYSARHRPSHYLTSHHPWISLGSTYIVHSGILSTL
jgi:hypothetical protein